MKIEVQIRKAKKKPYKTASKNEQYTIIISEVSFFESVFKKKLPNGMYRVYVYQGVYTLYNITNKNHSKYLGDAPDYIINEIHNFLHVNQIDKQELRDKGIW